MFNGITAFQRCSYASVLLLVCGIVATAFDAHDLAGIFFLATLGCVAAAVALLAVSEFSRKNK